MNNEDVLRFFDQYADDAFRLAYSYLGSRPDAEDVVQDVFLKLIRSDITIAKGKEKSYIFTMVANRCRDVLGSGNVVFRAPFEDAADAKSEIKLDEEDSEQYYIHKGHRFTLLIDDASAPILCLSLGCHRHHHKSHHGC